MKCVFRSTVGVKDIEHIKMTSSNLEKGDDEDEKDKERPLSIIEDEGDLGRETKKRFEERLSNQF
jgi:hypothetical protein